MIVPGRLAILLGAVFTLLLILAVVDSRVSMLAIPADGAIVGMCFWQGRRLRRLAVSVNPDRWPRAQSGKSELLAWRIANRSRKPVILRLRQRFPAGIDADQTTFELRVPPGQIVTAALPVTPRIRGTVAIAPADVDVGFAWDWARYRWATEPAELKVFPSLKGMHTYEQLWRHHASNLIGTHRQRMLGAGREFDQLRDYTPDDDYRDVNWMATARHCRPISNVYQAERSRDVIICIDCGRMMGNPSSTGTVLDRAVDAAILLAHVANRQGDRVGLMLFRDVVHRVVKPASGIVAVRRMMEVLVDARSEGVFPSYAALMSALRLHQNRRSLVLLFTDLNDPQLAANLVEVMPLISRKHLLVVISLADALLDKVADGAAANSRELFRAIAARKLTSERQTRTRELQRAGAMVVQADSESLSVELINTYLSIKTRQLL
ncbi:MAG TPA: DUF58 domain-containing protein [Tepidisphaeraceae bacterium]|jgi:uncharacterized protein (DUF58 family)|nr:DUF58 domain-containing protein [Tepidisphaeraceae bacterium]